MRAKLPRPVLRYHGNRLLYEQLPCPAPKLLQHRKPASKPDTGFLLMNPHRTDYRMIAQGNDMDSMPVMPVTVSPLEQLLLFNKNFFAQGKACKQFVVILNWPAND